MLPILLTKFILGTGTAVEEVYPVPVNIISLNSTILLCAFKFKVLAAILVATLLFTFNGILNTILPACVPPVLVVTTFTFPEAFIKVSCNPL